MARILAAWLLIGAVAWLIPVVSAGDSGERKANESEKKGRSPYARVATGHPPEKDGGKVYTNSDLEKMFGIVEEDDEGETGEGEPAPKTTTGSAAASELPDPLTWLANRQKAQAEHRAQIAEAEKELAAARERLQNLEKQLLAVRNPFSARPTLSDEEKERRRKEPETATERLERTQKLVEEAREDVRAAEAKLAELRSKRP